MDVKSLFTNIKDNEGILALKIALNNRVDKAPKTELITTLMELILTLNCFNFNDKHYLQVKGCAMGTATAPSYANLFMANFEETYIYPKILEDCLIYVRYIDDIFFYLHGNNYKTPNFLQLHQ